MSAATFIPRIPIAAITDEFSPILSEAIPVMREIGMTGAELRVIDGKNILDLDDEELKRARDALAAAEIRVISIASPLLKCVLPNSPKLDERYRHDVFASVHTFKDQPRLTERALAVADFFQAPLIRVFSYWRTVSPELCLEPIAAALRALAALAESAGIIIAVENEHACNLATGAEIARALKLVPHPNLAMVWDPANALIAGEIPFPEGYGQLPKDRIVHVHAKDCHLSGGQPVWGPLGTRRVPWKEQVAALLADNFKGYISLETHWSGPGGNKLEASRICGWNLCSLASGQEPFDRWGE